MKSVLVIFLIGAVSALAHKHRSNYEFEGPKFPWGPSQDLPEQFVNSPRIPWNLPRSSWNSADENEDEDQDQSEPSENFDSPRIPWELPRWGAPEFEGPQTGFRAQNRMDWSGFFVPASQRLAKRSHLDQERMKKIMIELEDAAQKVYETFEILKGAAAENSQEEIENIVADALDETLSGMSDAKDYVLETGKRLRLCLGSEESKQCIKDLEGELDQIVEETKEIPVPECSPSESTEVVDSFEDKVNQFNETMKEIAEMNERIDYNIKNCPFRNPRPCHKGLLSLENSARHAIREGHHQIQMMEKAIDMQGVETDQCRDTYLEKLIAQENEYNKLLEQCSEEKSYENDEYNEIINEDGDYSLGNEEEEDQYNEEKMNESINEEADNDEEIEKEETKEDEEDGSDNVPYVGEVNEEEINEDEEEGEGMASEDDNEENNAEEKLEEELESTTPLA